LSSLSPDLPETQPDSIALAEALRPDLLKFFKPAFLGRLIVVPYLPITDQVLRAVVRVLRSPW
jgi:type VI secretion system protein VasG